MLTMIDSLCPEAVGSRLLERHLEVVLGKPVNQHRTVSLQIAILRSNSRSSTFRSESRYRTYSITTRRITSGDELKFRKGFSDLGLLIRFRYAHDALPDILL